MQAEKNGIVEHAQSLLAIRNIRNIIALEYKQHDAKEIFLFVFRHSLELIDILQNAKYYSKKFYID